MAIIKQDYGTIGGGGISNVEYLYIYNSMLNVSNIGSTPLPTTKKAKALVIMADDARYNGQCYLGVVIDGINNNHVIRGSGWSEGNFDALFTFNDSNIVVSQVTYNFNVNMSFAIIYD